MKKRIIALAVVAFGAVLIVSTVIGGQNPPPPMPTVASPAKQVGDSFGVDGPDGKPIICANGKELRVPKGLLNRPPLPPQAQAPNTDGIEMGWRCGTGANPDRNPRLVPLPE